MSLNVHLHFSEDYDAVEQLKERIDPTINLTVGKVLPETAVPHILISGRPSREVLLANPQIHTLIIPWAGIPAETRELMSEFPHIAIHNLHHNAQPVAEAVLTLLLAAAKFVVPFDQSMRRHDWSPRYERPLPTLHLGGKTALILGYGAIGQRVGTLCQALGMRVIATKRHVAPQCIKVLQEPVDTNTIHIFPPSALHELLPHTNALIICLPLTPETEGLIGESELNTLSQKAILVNIGRAPIVDEGALYHALKDGRLHAAGLDVWYRYPKDKESRTNTPPSEYPFHELENVVMSPHRGGAADRTESLRVEYLADLLNTAVRDEPLPNRMDLNAGY
ncbi:MAG: hydroxyacid dehydrogenase [Chloroflexi bacterium]|nr:hydroxyacid dehydrogenase [Chloroflexota bacterium]